MSGRMWMKARSRLLAALLGALLVVLPFLALPVSSRGADCIEVLRVRGKAQSEKEKESEVQKSESSAQAQDEHRGFRIEDIPAGRLIEPAPPHLQFPTRRKVAVDNEHLAIAGGTGSSRMPTDEEWQRIRDVLYGMTPAVPPAPPAVEKPPPEEAMPAPAKPPAPPSPLEKAPPEAPPKVKKPAAEEIPPMPTQQAVSLALKVGATDLSKDYARVAITSGRISGSTGDKTYDFVGDFTLFYRDIVATGGKGRLDQDAETARLSQDVLVKEPRYDLASDELDIRFKQKTLVAKKFVQFKKKEKSKEPTGTDVPKRQRVINIFKNEPTEVYCNSLRYNWDTEEMKAKGEVKVVQKDFTATMDELSYNPRTKLYQLKGNVFATLLNTDWLFEYKLVEPKDEQLTKALTEKESTMSADFVEVGEDSDLMTMRGIGEKRAELKQEDKYLRANEIVVDDSRKLLTATGSVEFYQENGDWLEKGGLVEKGAEEELKKRLGKPVTSTSQNLSYDYDKRILRQWGRVELLGENEALFADELTYDEKSKLLHLKGNVTYYRGEDEYVYADEVLIDTNKNTFKFIGVVEGLMFSTEKAREKATAAKAEAEAAQAEAASAGEAGAPTAPAAESGAEAGAGAEGGATPTPPGGESPKTQP